MMSKASSNGVAATENASRYLQQMSKHFSHRFPAEFDAEHSRVELPSGRIMMTATPAELQVNLEVDNADDLPRLQTVLVEHIDRFAFREAPLPFVWS